MLVSDQGFQAWGSIVNLYLKSKTIVRSDGNKGKDPVVPHGTSHLDKIIFWHVWNVFF